MRIINIKLIFFLLFGTTLIFGQNNVLFELEGKWEAYKKTTIEGEDGSDMTFDGKPFTVNLIIEFLDNKNLNFKEGDLQYTLEYKITRDKKLIIKNRKYSIIKFDDQKMILKEEMLFGNLVYFKKVKL